MKKTFFFAAFMLAAILLRAADVDVASAQFKAKEFLCAQVSSGRQLSSAAVELKLVHTELNSAVAAKPVYYIFNSCDSYVIVSGDDRAEAILAYGDAPLDVNDIPDNMQFWLEYYKAQLEHLQANPGLVVENSASPAKLRQGGDVAPMLTAMWNQEKPYDRQCPYYSGQYCYTGCPATALAEVFYYWKYPDGPTPTIPGYTTETQSLVLPALEPMTFDWDNMLETYTTNNYTTEQGNAVAWLMRYIGQAEEMDYTILGSGAYGFDVLRAVLLFGYDEGASIVYKSADDEDDTQLISDEDWAAMILNELYNGRPIVYCGYHYASFMDQYMGHSFDVDGYDATADKYHINWGWSGNSNGYFALNAFKASGFTYNIYQQMIIGIQPPDNTPSHGYDVGDVNHDGSIDVDDVTLLISYILGSNLGICTTCADVDGNGNIDVTDVTFLISNVLGNS